MYAWPMPVIDQFENKRGMWWTYFHNVIEISLNDKCFFDRKTTKLWDNQKKELKNSFSFNYEKVFHNLKKRMA